MSGVDRISGARVIALEALVLWRALARQPRSRTCIVRGTRPRRGILRYVRGTIVAIGIAIAVVRPAPLAAGAAPACTPGTLVSSAPYLPSEVLLTRDGRHLIVVDRGALTVRDPATLAVRRTLLPVMDGWQSAYESPDGGTVLAETVDGLRFSFDSVTWRATRLADDRDAIPGQRRNQDEARWTDLRFQGLSALTENEARFWQLQRPRLGLPALPAGVEATAVAHAIVRTRAGQTVLDPLDPIAPGDDPSRFRIVVADTAGTLHLYDDRKELKSSTALTGTRIVRLDVSGQRILAALATGEVLLLDPGLGIEARVTVMPAPPALATAGVRRVPLKEPAKETTRHGIMAMQYDPASRRLTYVSTAHAIGVFDIGARRTIAELHATGIAIVDALFVDEARVVLLTDAGVSLWDAVTGARLRARAGEYGSLLAAGGGVLAIGAQGTGDLLDAATLAARRRVCFLAQGCKEKPPVRPDGVAEADWTRMSIDAQRGLVDALMPPEDRRFEAAVKRIYITRSPDGRSLAVLQPPIEAEERKRAGALTVWDARTLTVRRRTAIDSCYDWKLAYAGPRALDVCGDQHRDATTLARIERAATSPDRGRRSDASDLTAVGSATVEIRRSQQFDGGDVVSVVDRGGKPLLDIARPESKANAPELRIGDQERAQFRSRTFAVEAPGGRRFLLAGRGAGEEGPLPGLVTVSGPLQVWCTPAQRIADTKLPPPPEPQTAEIDGIAESALDGFPEKIIGAAEVAGGVLVLGSNLAGDAQSLVAVDTATGRLTAQPLPAGGPWLRILPAPGGETAWLQGKRMVVRREIDQRWTSFALDARRDETPFFAPLSARTAVHVVRRACTPEETAASKSERNLREYYAHNRPRLTVPPEVEGSEIELMIDAQGPDDQGAQQNLRRRRDAVAALLASGADFAAAQARAIRRSPDWRLDRHPAVDQRRTIAGERPAAGEAFLGPTRRHHRAHCQQEHRRLPPHRATVRAVRARRQDRPGEASPVLRPDHCCRQHSLVSGIGLGRRLRRRHPAGRRQDGAAHSAAPPWGARHRCLARGIRRARQCAARVPRRRLGEPDLAARDGNRVARRGRRDVGVRDQPLRS